MHKCASILWENSGMLIHPKALTGPALQMQKLASAFNTWAFSTRRLAWCQISAERQQEALWKWSQAMDGTDMPDGRSHVPCLTSLQNSLGALQGRGVLSQHGTGNRQPSGRLYVYGAFPIPGYRDQDHMKPIIWPWRVFSFTNWSFLVILPINKKDLFCPAIMCQTCNLSFRY